MESCREESRVKITNGSVDSTVDWTGPTPNQFGSAGPSRRSCRLLNLLFEDEDALPLLRGQHGDLFWGQLQNLHDESSLEDRNRKRGPILHHIHTHRRIKHLKLKSKVCFSRLMRHLFSLCCTIKKTNISLKSFAVVSSYCFLNRPFLLALKGDATQDDLQLVGQSRNEEWFCLRFLATPAFSVIIRDNTHLLLIL